MKKNKIYFFGILAVLLSCNNDNDDDFVNLSSSITLENTFVGATEGSYLYTHFFLDEPLSEDVILEGTFSIEGITNYINDDDYTQGFEYSNDNGTTWYKEDNAKQIIFKAGTQNLKTRITTNDDDAPETTEEFKIAFSSVSDNINLTYNNDLEVLLSLYDDEVTESPYNSDVLMEMSINEDGTYEIVGISNIIINETAKKIIDGNYKDVMDAVLKVVALGDVKLQRFELLYQLSGIGGYVFNPSQTPGEDKFLMGLNTSWGFQDLSNPSVPDLPSFNSNGFFGYLIAHEYAHLLTLNYETQIDYVDLSIPPTEPCLTYFVNQAGCSKNDSYINNFRNEFYMTPPSIPPFFVSNYAATSTEEDIAESFALYVAQENVNGVTPTSSDALRKLNFMLGETELHELKAGIRSQINIAPGQFQEEIFAYQVSEDGEPMSCSDYYDFISSK